MGERQLLSGRPAEGEADDVRALDLAGVEDPEGVVRELPGRVRPGRRIALSYPAGIGSDAAVGPTEVGKLDAPRRGRRVQPLQPEHRVLAGIFGPLVDEVQPRPVLRDDLYAPSSSRTCERRCW